MLVGMWHQQKLPSHLWNDFLKAAVVIPIWLDGSADEPTANLDSATADALLDLMERMNAERGVTFLFSTHDVRVMERARRIVHLRDGRIEREQRRDP